MASSCFDRLQHVSQRPREKVSSVPHSDIFRANVPENNIIQKGLAFARDWSGTVAHSGSEDAQRSCPAGSVADAGLRWCGATPLSTERRDLKCQRLRRNHHLLRLFPSL